MKQKLFTGRNNWQMPLLLMIISAVVYLPWVGQIGYLNDDWYLMYSAHAYGPGVFTDIFSVDRPMRALVMIPAYILFGDNPFYYNVSAYVFRLVSSISFLWLLQMLWPRQRGMTFLATLFFLIYPGFLSQINGIDYQSQMVSLAAAMCSIALSVKAVQTNRLWLRIILIVISTVLGWFYLGLVEYFLGLEFLRFASLFILAFRENTIWGDRLRGGVKYWLPNVFVPLVFLVWRLFIFESERGATDVGLQLGVFSESPIVTIFWWLIHLVADSLDVLFFAWGIPFYNLFPELRLRHVILGLAAVVLFTFLIYKTLFSGSETHSMSDKSENGYGEMLFLGFGMVIAGLIPVILVNRQVDFSNFSRYALASSPGSSLVLVVLLFHIGYARIRWVLISLLLAISVFTHHANALNASITTSAMKDFWWQVSWRVPQIEKGTTLIANYPVGGIAEDYFVWGPANLIYYPTRLDEREKIRPALYAAVLNTQTRNKILYRKGQEHDNRKNIITLINYRNILILTRPTISSCIQIVNGLQPEFSASETSNIMLIASHSELEKIILDAEPQIPPQIIFGSEPFHGWCYYYEKADLARQRGDWGEVMQLGNEVFDNELIPGDPIEWMPFLQAYALKGDVDRLIEIKDHMKNASPYVFQQACNILTSMSELSDPVMEAVTTNYCVEQ